MSKLKLPEVLNVKSFRYFLLTRIMLTLGLQMQAVVVGWQIYKLTQDPFSLGLIGLAEAIPALSIALYAGHIADIHNKKKDSHFCTFRIIILLSRAIIYS